MVNLALVTTGSQKIGHPSLGVGYLASYLRKYLHFKNITIIDKEKNTVDAILKQKPDIIGISSSTHFFNEALEIARKIRNRIDVPILIGGSHITALPDTLAGNFDIGILGEGEQTLLELMQIFLDYKEFAPKNLRNVKGIAYHYNGGIVMHERRPLIADLDTIPYPARDLYKMEKEYLIPRVTFSLNKLSKSTHILTSRGCCYFCTFCSSSAFWQRIRYHSPEYVVGEIKQLIKNYKIDEIGIFDDLFIADKERFRKIVELLESEGLNDKCKYRIHGRANLIDEDMCKLIDRMNIKSVAIGFESQSSKVLNYLKKGTTTIEQNQKAVDMIKKSGLLKKDVSLTGLFMIGTPNETKEDMEATLKFIKENPIDELEVCVTTPLPGTELWEYAENKNLVSDYMDWDMLNIKSNCDNNIIMMDDAISKEDFNIMCNRFTSMVEERNGRFKLNGKDLLSIGLWKLAIKNYRVAIPLLLKSLGGKKDGI